MQAKSGQNIGSARFFCGVPPSSAKIDEAGELATTFAFWLRLNYNKYKQLGLCKHRRGKLDGRNAKERYLAV